MLAGVLPVIALTMLPITPVDAGADVSAGCAAGAVPVAVLTLVNGVGVTVVAGVASAAGDIDAPVSVGPVTLLVVGVAGLSTEVLTFVPSPELAFTSALTPALMTLSALPSSAASLPAAYLYL